jgi:outer membrane protein OmpA-like peptidoglycan-associated protein
VTRSALLGASVGALFFAVAQAQESPARIDSIIDKLAPSTPGASGSSDVLSVQAATESEIVGRLAGSESRSIGPAPADLKLPEPTTGLEAKVMQAIRGLPSMQVSVAFQGASDALAPESGALLDDLGRALNNSKLSNSRFLVGVHTDAIGSDEYNLDLSALRAKAIVNTMTLVHGIAQVRLVPVGFGRVSDPGAALGAGERIQIVNLGPIAPEVKPNASVTAQPVTVAPAGHLPVQAPRLHPPRIAALQPVGAAAPTHDRYIWRHSDIHRRKADIGDKRARPAVSPIEPAPNGLWPFGSAASGSPIIRVHAGGGGAGGGGAGGGGAGGGGAGGGGAGGGGAGGGGGGGGGGAGWSDLRLKRHIQEVGTTTEGFGLYSFQYRWGGPEWVGVMAQEVKEKRPDVVGVSDSGYLFVDYTKLCLRMITREAFDRDPTAVNACDGR